MPVPSVGCAVGKLDNGEVEAEVRFPSFRFSFCTAPSGVDVAGGMPGGGAGGAMGSCDSGDSDGGSDDSGDDGDEDGDSEGGDGEGSGEGSGKGSGKRIGDESAVFATKLLLFSASLLSLLFLLLSSAASVCSCSFSFSSLTAVSFFFSCCLSDVVCFALFFSAAISAADAAAKTIGESFARARASRAESFCSEVFLEKYFPSFDVLGKRLELRSADNAGVIFKTLLLGGSFPFLPVSSRPNSFRFRT